MLDGILDSSANRRKMVVQILVLVTACLFLTEKVGIAIAIERKEASHLLRTPPSREAFKHSGGESRLCTSATVTWENWNHKFEGICLMDAYLVFGG